MKRTIKQTKEVVKREGLVELLLLHRDGYRDVWAVSFPHKVGNTESTLRITDQFMLEDEAVRAYGRYVEFFNGRNQ